MRQPANKKNPKQLSRHVSNNGSYLNYLRQYSPQREDGGALLLPFPQKYVCVASQVIWKIDVRELQILMMKPGGSR